MFVISQKLLSASVLADIAKSGISSVVILENPDRSSYHAFVTPGKKPFSKYWT